MKKIINHLVIFVLLTAVVACNEDPISQQEEAACDNGTFVGIVQLNSQQDVDDWGAQCYTKINGALNIGLQSDPNNDITDLSALDGLTEIFSDNMDNGFGSLSIYSQNLTSLNGLNNITSIGRLSIIHCDSLLDLTGLEGLEVVHRYFSFTGLSIQLNINLESLNGLENLTTIGNATLMEGAASMAIINNPELINVDGLSGLQEVYGTIQFWTGCGITDGEICNNPILDDFCGLQNLFVNGIYDDVYLGNLNAGGGFNPTVQDIIDGNCSL